MPSRQEMDWAYSVMAPGPTWAVNCNENLKKTHLEHHHHHDVLVQAPPFHEIFHHEVESRVAEEHLT